MATGDYRGYTGVYRDYIGYILGFYRDNGTENGNYHKVYIARMSEHSNSQDVAA